VKNGYQGKREGEDISGEEQDFSFGEVKRKPPLRGTGASCQTLMGKRPRCGSSEQGERRVKRFFQTSHSMLSANREFSSTRRPSGQYSAMRQAILPKAP
jgi:hypothetical protein